MAFHRRHFLLVGLLAQLCISVDGANGIGNVQRKFEHVEKQLQYSSQNKSSRDSNEPYGIRIAYEDTDNAITVTYSTKRVLQSNPCVQLRVGSKTANRYINLRAARPPVNQENIQQKLRSNYFVRRESEDEEKFSSIFSFCGKSQQFIEPSIDRTLEYVHRIEIPRKYLSDAGSLIRYTVGNDVDGWQDEWYTMVVPVESNAESASVLLFGDMGADSHALSLEYVRQDIDRYISSIEQYGYLGNEEEHFSAVLHVGDIGYDLRDYHGHQADKFLQMAEPLSSSVPYMVLPGNHEAYWNFSHFRALYSMPRWPVTENLHYSFDIGPIHIVSINTEVFYWPDSFSESHIERMFQWFEKDLRLVRQNSKQKKWIIVMGHRPMYCARAWGNDFDIMSQEYDRGNPSVGHMFYAEKRHGRCPYEQEALRLGIPSDCPKDNARACHPLYPENPSDVWPIEELLNRFEVDLYVSGHIHCYVRFHPTYNYEVDESSFDDNEKRMSGYPSTTSVYKNPRFPIHVISGAGGKISEIEAKMYCIRNQLSFS